ncbi:MAG: hypothetical protein SFV17_22895 [Candidatus Obscuribacter sp.]|nr:hypothetical protein [Candidatus Melainabacteria bacterium]MDX1989555.1 hypothetical protein [Candidatus Obscuribacter sp.]
MCRRVKEIVVGTPSLVGRKLGLSGISKQMKITSVKVETSKIKDLKEKLAWRPAAFLRNREFDREEFLPWSDR